ncbi:ankyrin repeat-containing domain protein [Morchella snyderi]|nr:ankyrin repeat-containing domain protein [Morchella snyderi]
MYDSWNLSLLISSIALFLVTSAPQPRSHASIMLCTAFLGTRLAETGEIGFVVYIITSAIVLILSPLQLLLLFYLSPKPETNHGIVVHYPVDENGPISVDIVAVHGLGSNPEWAWTWGGNGAQKKCMWLKDLLPKSVPRARILTYNHNSAWMRDAPVKTVRDCGKQLLAALDSCREEAEAKNRPIIFIGHSFGGIIIKKALVMANSEKRSRNDGLIKESMRGAIFLGVPHDGSQLTAFGKLASYCTYWLGSSTELLEALQSGCSFLRDLNQDFIDSYGESDLVDFYELHLSKTMGIPLLMGVDAHSSTNPGVKRVALESDHVGMNKFGSEKQHNYQLVCRQITRMVAKIEEDQQNQLLVEKENQSSENARRGHILRWISRLEPQDDLERLYSKRHDGTGTWIMRLPTYERWLGANERCLLWCHGSAGVGKSVLTSVVIKDLCSRYPPSSRIGVAFFYFSFQRTAETTLSLLFSVLIKQLCWRQENLPKSLTDLYERCDAQGISLPTQEELQSEFEGLIGNFKEVVLVLDALDECPKVVRKVICNYIAKLLQNTPDKLKILVTSRPEDDIRIAFKSSKFETIEVAAKNVTPDIKSYVLYTLANQEGSGYAICDDINLQQEIFHALLSHADGMFLWVQSQLDYVYELPSKARIQKALKALPKDMRETYQRIVEKIKKQIDENVEIARLALTWVVYSARPLQSAALAFLVAVESTGEWETLLKGPQLYETRWLMNICCGLLTARDDVVRPVHFTVVEFLRLMGDFVNKDESVGHGELAARCIECLIGVAGSQGRLLWTTPEEEFLEQVGGPGLVYAIQFWHYHLGLSPLPLPPILEDLFKDYINSPTARNNFREKVIVYSSDETPSPLMICAGFGILHVYSSVYADTLSSVDFEQQREVLQIAAMGGSVRGIELLLNVWGRQFEELAELLSDAAMHGKTALVEHLLDYGLRQDLIDSKTGQHPFIPAIGRSLQWALTSGYIETSRVLLARMGNPSLTGGTGWWESALEDAANSGRMEVVELVEQAGRGYKVVTDGGTTYGNALNAVASDSPAVPASKEVILYFLEKGLSLNTPGHSGPVLCGACARVKMDVETVQLMLDRGADVNARGGSFATPLQGACAQGNIDIVALLIKNGADVNAIGGLHGTALMAACDDPYEYRSTSEIVEYLIASGSDVNIRAGQYGSALQTASADLDLARRCAPILIRNGAEVNALGGKYHSALQAAAISATNPQPILRSDGSTLALLLRSGANPDVSGGGHPSALMSACYAGDMKLVNLLISAGADVNVSHHIYGTALQSASYRGNQGVVELLLSKGADVNALGGKYGTALVAGSRAGSTDVLKILLSNGADVNGSGGRHPSALTAACESNNIQCVELLELYGADINAAGGKYGNALQAAAHGGYTHIMEYLLARAVDIVCVGGKYGTALQAASHKGREDAVAMLISKGATGNELVGKYGTKLRRTSPKRASVTVPSFCKNDFRVSPSSGIKGSSVLVSECASGNTTRSRLKVILAQGADVNQCCKVYGTPLLALCAAGAAGPDIFVDCVRLLLARGSDVKASGGRFGTVIQAAAGGRGSQNKKACGMVAEILFRFDADVNAMGGVYGTALQAACYRGDYELARGLLKQGANVNARGGRFGSALIAASHSGQLDVISKLIEHSADINMDISPYGSALQAAAYSGHHKAVQFLLDHGANINFGGGRYGTPLNAAIDRNRAYVADLLLRYGADARTKGGRHGNALQAAVHHRNQGLVELLLDYGADVNAHGGLYGSALQSAILNGDEDIIHLLLERGARINKKGGKYNNALQAASLSGKKSMVKLVISHGLAINTIGGPYHNALQCAVLKGDRFTVLLLITSGFDVNCQGGKYGNALQAAAVRGWVTMIRLLIFKGANVNAQGGKYPNALHAAIVKRHKSSIECLLENGADIQSLDPRCLASARMRNDQGVLQTLQKIYVPPPPGC